MAFQEPKHIKVWSENVLRVLLLFEQQGLVSRQKLDFGVEGVKITASVSTDAPWSINQFHLLEGRVKQASLVLDCPFPAFHYLYQDPWLDSRILVHYSEPQGNPKLYRGL